MSLQATEVYPVAQHEFHIWLISITHCKLMFTSPQIVAPVFQPETVPLHSQRMSSIPCLVSRHNTANPLPTISSVTANLRSCHSFSRYWKYFTVTPFHVLPAYVLLPSSIPSFCSQPIHSINYNFVRTYSGLMHMYNSHSFISRIYFYLLHRTIASNLQNHASVLDLCPMRFSSVTSPAIFISLTVMLCNVER